MDIQCTNLKKIYQQKTVLSLDKLDVPKGSVLGVIGANGCGKTTLLYILGNLLAYDSGDIHYDGMPFNRDIANKLTLVFQKPIMLRTTVHQNIAYPLTLRKTEKNEKNAIIQATMDKLELAHLSKQMATTLSGGEKQKIALARSAVICPELLLLDEPTASIDPSSIQLMERMILGLNQQGTTVIIVTHNIMQAKRICTDIVFLEQGRIIEQGKTLSVLNNPKTEKLQNFMEYGAM